jgi:ribosomal protein S17E
LDTLCVKRHFINWLEKTRQQVYTLDMVKVYLETTIFNRFFEHNRDYCRETKELFEKIRRNEIAAFSSAYVLEEIDKAMEPKRSNMLNLITQYKITVLEIDKRAYDLAETYIEMGVIPVKFRIDGIHIAMTAIHDIDCIVSLNFHHINKLKTKMATEIIHRMKGYTNPFICTPMEVPA